MSAAKDRFTMNTTTSSDPQWRKKVGKDFALLFKVSWSMEGRFRTLLRKLDSVFVQTCESGPRRTHNVVEFLSWALPQGTPIRVGSTATPVGSKPTQPVIIVMLDWFAAHLSRETRDLLHKKGCLRLMLGGGLTAIVQVNDTHLRKPLNGHIRSIELRDAAR
mgnify:CR=1 FL=1